MSILHSVFIQIPSFVIPDGILACHAPIPLQSLPPAVASSARRETHPRIDPAGRLSLVDAFP